jgi:cytochrome c oxidase cbb3-type subunit I/II
MNIETFKYDNRIVRAFAIATVIWGIVGMTAGLLCAWSSFTRERTWISSSSPSAGCVPLHTNAVIFAFVGNGMFMGIYYSLQRLCKARMFSDKFSWFNFWGWNAIIVAAAITLPLGIHHQQGIRRTGMADQDRHRHHLGGVHRQSLGTIVKRRENTFTSPSGSTLPRPSRWRSCTSSTAWKCPVSCGKAIPFTPACRTRWCNGGMATTRWRSSSPPLSRLMYYYLAQGGQPPGLFYRLSIIHFWALIFIYIWAGPHHLLYTALARLGAIARHGLLHHAHRALLGRHVERPAHPARRVGQGAPGSGAQIHGGRRDRLRHGHAGRPGSGHQDRQFAFALHGLDHCPRPYRRARLERIVDLQRALLAFPRLYKTPTLWSVKLANYHFWIALLGMMFYVIPMYVAGITEGMMWKQFTKDGFLQYPNFLETVQQIIPCSACAPSAARSTSSACG